MFHKRIVWKKWIDPFTRAEKDKSSKDDEGYHDSYEDRKESPENVGPMLMSPMGVIPLNESNMPSKVFNFWMMHTNFDIDEKVFNVLQNMPGVETLEILTRYRARISFGKVFKFSDKIRRKIRQELCGTKSTKSKDGHIDLTIMKNHLKSKYPFWAIFINRDNQVETKGHKDKLVIEQEIEQRKNSEKTKSIIASWEE